LGTESPWNLNLEQLLATKKKQEETMEEEKIQPYLVPFKVANSLASSVSKKQMPPQSKFDLSPVEELERDLGEEWRTSRTTGSKLRNALIRVRIDPCLRGVPEDFGLIYEMDGEEASSVRKKMESAKKNEKTFATGEGEGAEDVSPFFMVRKIISRLHHLSI
jgi:ribonuclease P/MRP protein subunit POP1